MTTPGYDDEVEVSAGTYRALEDIARRLDCNVEAALELVIAEWWKRHRSEAPAATEAPTQARTTPESTTKGTESCE